MYPTPPEREPQGPSGPTIIDVIALSALIIGIFIVLMLFV